MEKSPASDLYSSMRHVIADRSVPSVGGFVAVVSNRPEGFRYAVYSDMLYDWPVGQDQDYVLSLTDKLQLGASGENAGYSIAQLSPGFVGANSVAFYFVKSHALFVFFGTGNGPSNRCRAFRGVAPDAIVSTLTTFLGFDWKWLALVTSAPQTPGGSTASGKFASHYGIGMSFVPHLNTMPR
jgi:hypothetical protein